MQATLETQRVVAATLEHVIWLFDIVWDPWSFACLLFGTRHSTTSEGRGAVGLHIAGHSCLAAKEATNIRIPRQGELTESFLGSGPGPTEAWKRLKSVPS